MKNSKMCVYHYIIISHIMYHEICLRIVIPIDFHKKCIMSLYRIMYHKFFDNLDCIHKVHPLSLVLF